jgi:hypothetical protein
VASGNIVYVGYHKDTWWALQIIDVSNPSSPVLMGSTDGFCGIGGLAVSGNRVYMGDCYTLQIIDVSNINNPVRSAYYNIAGSTANGIAISGDRVYVAESGDWNGLEIIDVSNPLSPVLRGNYPTSSSSANMVAINGNMAYIVESSPPSLTSLKLEIIDVGTQWLLEGTPQSTDVGILNIQMTAVNSTGVVVSEMLVLDVESTPIPILVNNKLTINQGQTVVITSTMLNTINVNNNPAQLTYTITELTHGKFTLVGAPSTEITSFTQQQVNAGQIQFIQDSSAVAPSYMVSVTDGTITTTPTAATVTFTPVLVMNNNNLTINQGQILTIIPTMLNTTDVNNTPPPYLIYTITGLAHGKFILIDAPDTAITSFTQQQVNAGQIQFIQDGSAVAPSYLVSVTDGTITTMPTAATVTFTPVLVNNQLTVSQGQTILITLAMLNSTDANNTPPYLIYTITRLAHGKFILMDAPGTTITTFTQQQVNDGQVQFIQDGSTVAPRYMIRVCQKITSPLRFVYQKCFLGLIV